MANTNHLLDEIDVAVAALKVQKWTATLPFSGFLCKPTDDVLMASFQDRHDLFSLTQTIYKGFIVRFDPQTFPVVPGGVAKNKDSIKKLFDALMSMPIGKRCLHAFPELLFSDATHKTNRENRPLITFGVKDAEGRVQVVIRAWAPNERAWMFRWLFQTAVPAIIGKATCERIRLVLTDGDSQELTQLDAAISSVFTKCVRRRCGWHIIHQGWKQHVGSVGRSEEAKEIAKRIRSWLYSFMKSVDTQVHPKPEESFGRFPQDTVANQDKHQCTCFTNGRESDPVGSHEVLIPLYKELTQLCDIAGKDKTAKTARDLETLIIALKEEITSEQSPPTGKVVSCMVSKVSGKRKHVKQFKY
ncbi:MULE transposase domain containing protein [Nitzschia inconspicua]|uniref:MULE transposase domain containing protein n=1 Tax=Nitzschia inconspicua TaxID=303405 RepID=A0A9K3L811_9STRA|nr:MULE transposase domain containing protein [Nitzschia inconspicua]